MYGSAAALITDTDDPSARVLLVKPNYRGMWSLPGGILEDAEPPHTGCFREVEEELGLSLPAGPCSPWRGVRRTACGRGRS